MVFYPRGRGHAFLVEGELAQAWLRRVHKCVRGVYVLCACVGLCVRGATPWILLPWAWSYALLVGRELAQPGSTGMCGCVCARVRCRCVCVEGVGCWLSRLWREESPKSGRGQGDARQALERKDECTFLDQQTDEPVRVKDEIFPRGLCIPDNSVQSHNLCRGPHHVKLWELGSEICNSFLLCEFE